MVFKCSTFGYPMQISKQNIRAMSEKLNSNNCVKNVVNYNKQP